MVTRSRGRQLSTSTSSSSSSSSSSASASSASAGEEESLSLRKWNALLRLEELSSSAGAHDCPPSLLLALQCFYPVVDGKPMRLGQMFKLPVIGDIAEKQANA